MNVWRTVAERQWYNKQMTSFSELASSYARMIRSAVEHDRLRLRYGDTIDDGFVECRSFLQRVLNQMRLDIEDWTLGGKKLNPDERWELWKLIAQELGVADPSIFFEPSIA